ncbi:hypothetical protein NUW58_g4294 [Xylaria curta]|uniref:Uncharacterized protein n=1 Tax=Xylaria curta TaxID=42375 RepID=A0ACC1P8I9_9PEZI|nr:hypothetical protein NUW58_g4294 [Xylaria curta]
MSTMELGATQSGACCPPGKPNNDNPAQEGIFRNRGPLAADSIADAADLSDVTPRARERFASFSHPVSISDGDRRRTSFEKGRACSCECSRFPAKPDGGDSTSPRGLGIGVPEHNRSPNPGPANIGDREMKEKALRLWRERSKARALTKALEGKLAQSQ